MKAIPYLALLLLATACSSHRDDDVVSETYVHRYGVPLPADEWEDRGQQGQVVSARKDGVVVSRTYETGILHGETTYTYPHRDTIEKREFYDQGNVTQEVWNYSNGLPYKQVTHNSPTHQETTVWYENGVPQSQESYQNDKLVAGEYFTPSHVQEGIVDNQNGTRIKRDRFGNLESVDEIKEGSMSQRTTYHPNGTPEAVTPYVQGEPEGQRLTYHPGGEPATIESWKKGEQHGNTAVFQDGERVADVPYVNGQRHGTEYRYRDGEHVAEEVTWVKDVRHGPTQSYVGNTKNTSWYFQGKPVNKQTFDAMSNQ